MSTHTPPLLESLAQLPSSHLLLIAASIAGVVVLMLSTWGIGWGQGRRQHKRNELLIAELRKKLEVCHKELSFARAERTKAIERLIEARIAPHWAYPGGPASFPTIGDPNDENA